MDGEPDRVNSRSRRLRLIPIGAGLAVAILVALTGKLFVWPTPTGLPPSRVDAVLVLAGDRDDPLNRAMALMHKGIAPTLVIFDGMRPHWAAANALCNTTRTDSTFTYRVTCPHLSPDTTREAAEWARDNYGYNHGSRVAVVTPRHHLTRARLDMDRCLGSGFVMVSSTHHDALLTKANHVLHEWAGWLRDETIQRSC